MRWTFTSLAVLAAVGWGAGAASAATCAKAITAVPCTITTSGNYTLSANLSTTATTGSAITVTVDFVLLDLGGFKLEDTAAATTITTDGITAVNHKGVTIRNGTIRGFYRGVYLSSTGTSSTHQVDGLTVDGSRLAGIWVEGTGSVVRNSVVSNTGGTTTAPNTDTYGIQVVGSGTRVLNNDVTGTVGVGTGSGQGIYLDAADGAVADGNRLSNVAAGPSVGVNVNGGLDALVVGNDISLMGSGVVFGGGSGKYRDNLTSGVPTPFTGGTDAGNNE